MIEHTEPEYIMIEHTEYVMIDSSTHTQPGYVMIVPAIRVCYDDDML